MLFLLTQSRNSIINLNIAEHIGIIQKGDTYDLTFFKQDNQYCVIGTFVSEVAARIFLQGLCLAIEQVGTNQTKVLTFEDVYKFLAK